MKSPLFTVLLCSLFTNLYSQSPTIKQPGSPNLAFAGKKIKYNLYDNSARNSADNSNSSSDSTSGTNNASSGRVGIKTTAPMADFHVAGTVKVSGLTTFDQLAGEGYRMVVVDSNGVLSTMALPSLVDTTGVNRYNNNMKPGGYLSSTQVTQEYYFSSNTGNDNNTGTANAPFQTLAKLSSLTLTPGTRIWLKGGEVYYGTLTINGSGTEAKPIEIGSYGSQKAIINAGYSEGIIVDHKDWLIIHDLSLMGAGRKTGNTKNGLMMWGSNNSRVKDIVTSGFQKAGLLLYSCNNINAEYIYAHTNGFAGISVTGEYEVNGVLSIPANRTSRGITLRYCMADNNAGDPTVLDNHSGNGIILGSVGKCLVEYCTATNNGYDMPRGGNGPVGIWAYQADSVTIRKCISYRNKTSPTGHDGGGFDFDGGVTNSIMEYNLSYENQGAGYGVFQYWGAGVFSNNIVRYCISIEDGQKNAGGVYVWRDDNSGDFKNFTMHNCLIYNSVKPAIVFSNTVGGGTNFNFNNNVFIGKGDIVTGSVNGEKFLGNLWWNMQGSAITFRGYPTLAAWSNATGQEKNASGTILGIQDNPDFAGILATDLRDPLKLQSLTQYKPITGSPLLGNGLPASQLGVALPNEDFYGNPVLPNTISIALMRTP